MSRPVTSKLILLLCAIAVAGLVGATLSLDLGLSASEADPPATSGVAREIVEKIEQVNTLGEEGRYQESEELARSLLAEAEASYGEVSPEVAEVILHFIHALRESGKGAEPESLALAERAVRICESVHGSEHEKTILALGNLASIYYYAVRYDEAIAIFERLVVLIEEAYGPESEGLGDSLHNLAVLYETRGRYDEARPLLERSMAIRVGYKGAESLLVADSLMSLGALESEAGNPTKAQEHFERCLTITQELLGPEHPRLVGPLVNCGLNLTILGDYARARPYMEQARRLAAETLGEDHPVYAMVLLNLAKLLSDTGDDAAAGQLWTEVLVIQRRTLAPDSPDIGMALTNLAGTAFAAGDYEEARLQAEGALEQFRKSLPPDHPLVAYSLLRLGSICRKRGELAEAETFYERALEAWEKAGGLQAGLALDGLARVHHDSGSIELAHEEARRAAEATELVFGSGHPFFGYRQRLLAEFHLKEGDLVASLREGLAAHETFLAHFRATAASLSEREAIAYGNAVREARDQVAAVLVAAGGQEVHPGANRVILDAIIRSRAVVLDEIAGRHWSVRDSHDPELDELWRRLTRQREEFAGLLVETGQSGKREGLDRARGKVEELERELAARSASFREYRSKGTLGAEEAIGALAPDAALISYLVIDPPQKPEGLDEPVYLAMVSRAGRDEPTAVILGPASLLEDAVLHWREQVTRAPSFLATSEQSAGDAYREAGRGLRERIWDPLEGALEGASRVFVVPDGVLHEVSLDTLPGRKRGYLVDAGPLVHYLSTERDVVRGTRTPPGGAGFLALGDPSYDRGSTRLSPAGAGADTEAGVDVQTLAAVYRGPTASCEDFRSLRFGPLPGARAEVAEIAELWDRRPRRDPGASGAATSLILIGPRAAEGVFKREVSGRRIVHLATHAFFVPETCSATSSQAMIDAEGRRRASGDNPLLLAGLALAGANRHERVRAGEAADDGILTAEEIASIDLGGVEWVVLSGCETGRGELHSGEGVLGLRRAFELAGAGTLVMSLWKVEDRATRSWMRRLYEARFDGLSTAEAMRAARRLTLEERRRRGLSDHPFYWGAFVATGEWR